MTRAVLGCRMALTFFAAAALAHAAWDAPLWDWLSQVPVLCPVRRLTGLNCPGCGMTRAVTLLSMGRWEDCATMHPAALPAFLGTAAVAVWPSGVQRAVVMLSPGLRKALVWGCAGLWLAWCAARAWV